VKSSIPPGIGPKLGRNRPVSLGPHFKLHRYIRQAFPTPPPSCDYSNGGTASLRDVYGNDQLGDCVIACAHHVQGVATGNAGAIVTATLDQIIADYSAIGGYVPGDPSTDQGCDEVVALNYYCSKGWATNGTKGLGWLTVDATNRVEVMSAIYLFEHLIICEELPDARVNPFPSGDGFVWGSGTPNPNNGHSYMACGYDAPGVKIDTWAMFGTETWDGLAALATAAAGGGAYVVLTPDLLAKGAAKSPNGVAWADLVADFDAMGGAVPVPPPAPPPPPVPPAGPMTLAEAQAIAAAGFEADPHFIFTRGSAEAIVKTALAAGWRA
jgi:hypothetical protein